MSAVWNQLVGQREAATVLQDAVQQARAFGAGERPVGPAHAWLLTGPPGSGRSVAARAFAAALHCENTPAGCGYCKGCVTTMNGSHPDLSVTATEATVLRVGEVRPLIQLAQRMPTLTGFGGHDGWRVMLIEDADRLNETSGNALLKAIEEPPQRTLWLLCAPSPDDVLVTIRSRCRSVRLRVPPPDDVARLLVERDGVDPDMAAQAARAAQSHIGRAKRLAIDETARSRRQEVVRLAFGLDGVGEAVLRAGQLVDVASEEATAATADRDAREKTALLTALGFENATRLPPAARAQVRDLEGEQKRRATRYKRDMLDAALVDLQSVYRDVLTLQFGAPVDLVNPTERADLLRLADEATPAVTLQRLDAIGLARRRITTTNVNPLLATEAMMIGIVQPVGSPN